MRIFIGLVIVLVLIAAGGYFYVKTTLFKEIPHSSVVEVKIPNKASIEGAINIMNSRSMLKPDWLFLFAAKYYAKYENGTLYAGSYAFKPGMTNWEVLKSIFTGDNLNVVNVTIPEGISYRSIAEIFHEKANIDEDYFLYLCTSDSMLDARGINANTVEGYLMPDTYTVFKSQDADEVIDKLLNTSEKMWDSTAYAKADFLGFTRHETLTLASMIEAETPVDEEKRKISGVYHNRLEVNMLLQADPTVQFAIGSKRRLTYDDLKSNNPYNTYKFKGLPPGPINNPGRESIRAALNPEDHKYYYFVAVGDGSGEHNFARNLEQHNHYKAQFRRNVRNNR